MVETREETKKDKESRDHTKEYIGSAADVHPLVIKTKRASENAFGVRTSVDVG